jgi:hypothetical protein
MIFTAALCFFLAATLAAQTTATLTGTVTAQRSALPGVTITITSPSMQATRVAYSDVNGNFVFAAIPPGTYRVAFEMEGLETISREIGVGLAQVARADAQMSVSALSETISVLPPVSAAVETMPVQYNLQARRAAGLPMGRDLRAATAFAPGVLTRAGRPAAIISGAPSYESLYLIDGAVVNDNIAGYPNDLFIEDALQETTVLTAAIPAEYGGFTGGVVAAVTKSGSNDFTASIRESAQNPRWSATTPLGETRLPSKFNLTTEVTFGGPVVRDRLWFFTAGRKIDRSVQRYLDGTTLPYAIGQHQIRQEARLTALLTANQQLSATLLRVRERQTNACGGLCSDYSALDPERNVPSEYSAAHYSNQVNARLLIDANASRKMYGYTGAGSDAVGDVVHGTPIQSLLDGASYGAPEGCATCGENALNNRGGTLKATYFAATPRFGSHSIVAGFDGLHRGIAEDLHLSASDFIIGVNNAPDRDAAGALLARIEPGDYIMYFPVLNAGRATDFSSRSVFINDRVDLQSWSFNLGVRYDRNQGVDASGAVVARDSRISPRLSASYSPPSSTLKLTLGYAHYASQIADGAGVGNAASSAGAALYWLYDGAPISGVSSDEALKQVFAWFDGVGGIANRDYFLGGETGGISTKIPHALRTPGATEWTLGAGSAIASRGYARVDLVDRRWNNFYTAVKNHDTGTVYDPLADAVLDVRNITTSNAFERRYRALQLQTAFNGTRIQTGANYTYARLRGNYDAEAGYGAYSELSPDSYPEFLAYPNRNPVRALSSDQRHRLRAWASFVQPVRTGEFQLSMIQTLDSGLPYYMTASIDLSAAGYNKFGYATPPSTATYYFNDGASMRWDDVLSTDLALHYSVPVAGRASIFVKGEVRNAFNRAAQINGDTTVLTSRNRSCMQTANPGLRCAPFNPMTDTPVEGVNHIRGPRFGQPRTPSSFSVAGDYQVPRTFLVSVGARY